MGVESEYAVATPGKAFSAPGPILHAEDAERLAVLHPRIAVGDAHAHPLLAAEHRPDVDLGGGFDQRSRGIGAEKLGALGPQNTSDGIDDFHGWGSLGPRASTARVDERPAGGLR